MSRRVTVLMGGRSAEREVSLVSGRQCAEALRAEGYAVSELHLGADPAPLVAALSGSERPDVVFNALHGRYGEDGRIQGLLDLFGVPYTHSGVLASALAMDKAMARRMFASAGLPIADGIVADRETVLAGRAMDRPYVVKPISEGSSVRVHIVRENEPLPFGPEDWPYGDEDVLVERFIPGRELTVAVMSGNGAGTRALAVTEIRAQNGFYDYEAKYVEGCSRHIVPAPIDAGAYRAAMDCAVAAHDLLGCRGVTRSDFRYDDLAGEPGRLVLLEVNTQPGMTPLSLVPEQAAYCGLSFGALVTWLVEHARCD
ncbi:MAG: D-alanine--D-alanine ligase [Alphaproteobacteria bacterium]